MGRRVEHLDAARERLLDRHDRRFFVEQLIEVAKRAGPLADDGERQPLAVPSLYASRFHISSKASNGRLAASSWRHSAGLVANRRPIGKREESLLARAPHAIIETRVKPGGKLYRDEG